MLTKKDNGTSTKKGPGRIQCQGLKKAPQPKSNGGSWLGQHTNPKRNHERRMLRLRKFAAASWLSHWSPTVKVRKHKQHKHPLRDAHGAYTLTGRNRIEELFGNGPIRHVWLAGISAQRSY